MSNFDVEFCFGPEYDRPAAIRSAFRGVVDGVDGATSNVSVFDIDSEGALALRFAVKIPAPINGAAIVP